MIASWNWGEQPDGEQLAACLACVVREQGSLAAAAAGSTLSAVRLRQRLTVAQRYFTALSRTASRPEERSGRGDKDQQSGVAAGPHQKRDRPRPARGPAGLARVGSRAALSFAFAFLRRAWRQGEDADLCSDLLAESLDALQALPAASLYQTEAVSGVWLEVVERAGGFLRQVVTGEVAGGGTGPPSQDRHLALALLCELGLQRAGLAQLLGLILLLLDLWTAAREGEDNRVSVGGTRAPLLPLLSRLAEVEPSATAAQTGPSPPPTLVWLQWLELPEEPDSEVDLQQAAVTVMSHLDR